MTKTPTVGVSRMLEIGSSKKIRRWQPTFGLLIPISFPNSSIHMQAFVATLAVGAWVFQLAMAPTTVAGDPLGGPAQETAKFQEVAELERLEARVSEAIQKALPAIVAVDHPVPGTSPSPRSSNFAGAHGSGVIISPDGLILSQWHVSHEGLKGKILNAGDEIDVVLQDGRRLKAELLGAYPLRDVSLSRIIQEGDYPHVSLATPNQVRQGDRVLKLGHPFGYRASRGATARLGRVLYMGKALEIVADPLTFAGDSGGPLINLNGEVVGMLESSAAPRYVIWNLPDRLSNPTCYMGVESIERFLPAMRNPDRSVKLESMFRVKDLPGFAERESLRGQEIYGDIDSLVLPLDAWTQGEKLRAPWNELTRTYRDSVVEVLGAGRRVAYGTVVAADGWILTKASEIPDDPQVRIQVGRVVSARIAGTHAEFDLALLKIDADGLRPVKWSEGKVTPAGKLVAAPDGRGSSIGVGIVAVAQRELEGPFPKLIKKADPYVPKAAPIEVLFEKVKGKGLVVERVKGTAFEAGILRGDLLLALNGHPFRDHEEVDRYMEKSSVGDVWSIHMERDGKQVDFQLTLGEQPYVRCPGASGRYRNLRADDFPMVFEHDIPLLLDECGGPVINLEGKAIGVTIARVGEHGCMAIPSDAIVPLIAKLKR